MVVVMALPILHSGSGDGTDNIAYSGSGDGTGNIA